MMMTYCLCISLAYSLIYVESVDQIRPELFRNDSLIEIVYRNERKNSHQLLLTIQKYYSYEVLDKTKTGANFIINRAYKKIIQILQKCGNIKDKN